MVRLGAILLGLGMALIAALAGVATSFYAGTSRLESALTALATFAALAVYATTSARLRDRSELGAQIADLSRGAADLARQVLELSRRVAAAEATAAKSLQQAAAANGALGAEIERLGASIRQVAAAAGPRDGGLPQGESGEGSDAVETPSVRPEAAGSERLMGLDRDAVTALVREAVASNRIELHLQPIVSLPQRKVRFYQASAPLRLRNGELVAPDGFAAIAEDAGLMPDVDNAMLFRCVQAARRLLGKNREIGLFCKLSAATLADPDTFPRFIEFADANRAIAPALTFDIAQATFRAMGPAESESLGALADRGFRFALGDVRDLRIEARELADRGFRFVKVPASLLLNRAAAAVADADPTEMSGFLIRSNIQLIAEGVERESTVVDLLDCDVKLGLGCLFSPPRPVRPDVLQGPEGRQSAAPASPDQTAALRARGGIAGGSA